MRKRKIQELRFLDFLSMGNKVIFHPPGRVDFVEKDLVERQGLFLVRATGIEPAWGSPLDPKSSASASSATPANYI